MTRSSRMTVVPSFDEDLSIEGHALVLRDDAGVEVVRIDQEARVTVGFIPAPPKGGAADEATGSGEDRPGPPVPEPPPRGPGTIRVVGIDGSDAIVLDGSDPGEDPRAQD